jgi:hypothetical protein
LPSMALMKISPLFLAVVSKVFDFGLTVAPCHPPRPSFIFDVIISTPPPPPFEPLLPSSRPSSKTCKMNYGCTGWWDMKCSGQRKPAAIPLRKWLGNPPLSLGHFFGMKSL